MVLALMINSGRVAVSCSGEVQHDYTRAAPSYKIENNINDKYNQLR